MKKKKLVVINTTYDLLIYDMYFIYSNEEIKTPVCL